EIVERARQDVAAGEIEPRGRPLLRPFHVWRMKSHRVSMLTVPAGESGRRRTLRTEADRLCAVSFRRALGPFDATMVVIGGIVGSGIFINPYIVAQRLARSWLAPAGRVSRGAIALAGAFAYAELGALFPKAGGQYVYLRDGWHPLAGFLYGWALLMMIETGAIAAVAITFATHALPFMRGPE